MLIYFWSFVTKNDNEMGTETNTGSIQYSEVKRNSSNSDLLRDLLRGTHSLSVEWFLKITFYFHPCKDLTSIALVNAQLNSEERFMPTSQIKKQRLQKAQGHILNESQSWMLKSEPHHICLKLTSALTVERRGRFVSTPTCAWKIMSLCNWAYIFIYLIVLLC